MMIVHLQIQTRLNYLTATFILHSPLLMANQQLNQNINPVLLHKVHLTNSVLLTTSKGVIIDSFSPMICKYCAISFIQALSHSSIPQDWQTHCVMQFLFQDFSFGIRNVQGLTSEKSSMMPIAVYKSRDKTSVSNYKPKSLLCIFGKNSQYIDNISTICLFNL